MSNLTPEQAIALIDSQLAAANLPPAQHARARAIAITQLEVICGIKIETLPEPHAFLQLMRDFEEPTRRVLAAVDGGAK